jgi:hypothetical protein
MTMGRRCSPLFSRSAINELKIRILDNDPHASSPRFYLLHPSICTMSFDSFCNLLVWKSPSNWTRSKLIAQHLQVNSIESCQAKNKLPAAQVFFVCSLYTRERGADDTHWERLADELPTGRCFDVRPPSKQHTLRSASFISPADSVTGINLTHASWELFLSLWPRCVFAN